MYEDEYIYFYRSFFDLNQSDWQNHNSSKEYKTILMTEGGLVVVDDYFDGIYAQVWPRPRVSVSVYVGVSLYDPRVHVRVLYCYLHRKLQLAFSTPDLVYDAVVFFLRFHRFSFVVWCGIWMCYFMITFYGHRRVFALAVQKFRANVHVTMKFHVQYN